MIAQAPSRRRPLDFAPTTSRRRLDDPRFIGTSRAIGRAAERREGFEANHSTWNACGHLSEDIRLDKGEIRDDPPQTRSLAENIGTPTRLPSSSEETWARA